MTTNTYNGWTNYETWLTNLHFENFDFSSCKEDGIFDDMSDEEIRDWVAEYIEQSVFDCVDSTENNLFISDIVNGFLGSVDWKDIAEHYVEDLKN